MIRFLQWLKGERFASPLLKVTGISKKDQANRQFALQIDGAGQKRIMDIKSTLVVKCELQAGERVVFRR
jgi:hypothetical protein